MVRTIVITGASDGIGAAAARRLHDDGHRVVVVGRSPSKTQAVAASIGTSEFHVADYTRLDDVRRLAGELAAYERIDVLANNAGGVFGDQARTVDGFEKTFQINHLAPFLLTTLLLETLLRSRASVLQTSSIGARLSPRLGDFEQSWSPIRAYGAAKLENILFTRELHRRYHEKGLSAAAFHPGNVASNFGSETTSPLMRFITGNSIMRRLLLVPPEKGAEELVWLAESQPGTDWPSGGYFEKHRPVQANPQADDEELARRLWARSEELVA